MPVHSKRKGKVYELHVAKLLTEAGFPARRGVQYSGNPDAPDVVCDALPYHIECKAQERLNIYDAVDQATEDCPKGKLRVIFHKKNRRGDYVTMPLDDFMELTEQAFGKESAWEK